MEGVKRNADRQKNIEMRWLIDDSAASHQPLEIFEQEISVLEEPEHAQIHRDAGDQPRLCAHGCLSLCRFCRPSQKSIAVVEKRSAAKGGFHAP